MLWLNLSVPKVMSVALIELVKMTATLNVVVSINSTTVMQTFGTAVATFRVPLTLIPALRSGTPSAPCTSSNAWKKNQQSAPKYTDWHIFFSV